MPMLTRRSAAAALGTFGLMALSGAGFAQGGAENEKGYYPGLEPKPLPPRPALSDGTKAAQLIRAYPDHLKAFENGALIWKDGTSMPWDDGIANKTFDQMLNNGDLSEQMSIPYAPGRQMQLPAVNEDPGRIRYIPFFKKMYGGSAAAVRANLKQVSWPSRTGKTSLPVTTVNNVAQLVEEIADELSALPKSFRAFFDDPAGTFVWREIAGSDALSMHSFGIALDISVSTSQYWRWTAKRNPAKEIPYEVIAPFEARNFIWGGKWFHFDTMHFEYRPELF